MVNNLKKPIYLLPFLYAFKLIQGIAKILKYISVGIFAAITSIINVIITITSSFLKYTFLGTKFFITTLLKDFIKYFFLGLLFIIKLILKLIKYICLGAYAPFYFIVKYLGIINKYNNKLREKQALESEKKAAARERNRQILEENKKRLLEVKRKEKEELDAQKEKQKAAKKTDVYINENVQFEKESFSSKLNESFKNSAFAKLFEKKEKDINREALLLDLEGLDAKKSEQKIMYKYVAKTEEGKMETGYFPAFSKVEVHSFLLSEGKEVYSIQTNAWIRLLYGSGQSTNTKKIKVKDLIFFITQLSTYVKAGITLVEALKILSNQFKNNDYRRIFRGMIYDLSMGDNFSDAMMKQGNAFPRLLINMVKASEMTGELPEALDDMTDYYTEVDKTRKQMITALTYPVIVLVIAIAAVIFIMLFVVPRFVALYEGLDGATLPAITVMTLAVSNFLQEYWIFLLLGTAVFLFVYVYIYRRVKGFKALNQWILMHVPVLGNVIIYNEVTMFTKTFASLLSHNVFITDSMEILNKITNNEIYKKLILETISNLAKGDKISLAFHEHWAFPIPAYEMIKTGEQTGQLPEMMQKVSVYYQELHKNSVTRIKTFIEPILIIFLAAVVGTIILAVIMPMFDYYGSAI